MEDKINDMAHMTEPSKAPHKAGPQGMSHPAVARKRWADMSPGQRTGTIVLAAVECAILVLALLDLRRRPAIEIRGSKLIWVLATFVQPFGPIAYFIFGRKRR